MIKSVYNNLPLRFSFDSLFVNKTVFFSLSSSRQTISAGVSPKYSLVFRTTDRAYPS